jgi:hypothetical protein
MTWRSRFDPRQRQRLFSSSLCVQTGCGAHPPSCTIGTGGPFFGGKSAAGAWRWPLTRISYPGREWVGVIIPLPLHRSNQKPKKKLHRCVVGLLLYRTGSRWQVECYAFDWQSGTGQQPILPLRHPFLRHAYSCLYEPFSNGKPTL